MGLDRARCPKQETLEDKVGGRADTASLARYSRSFSKKDLIGFRANSELLVLVLFLVLVSQLGGKPQAL